jgi:hypothetical protein
MTGPEKRAEPRIPVNFRGTLTQDGTTTPCVIQNMCSRGFLIQANKTLPVGHSLRLTCELYTDCNVECTVQVRHVNRDSLGAKVIEFSGDGQRVCRKYLDEQAAANQKSAA